MAAALRALLCPSLALAAVHVPSVQVAPGVQMPVVSIGTGGLEASECSTIVQNWLRLDGRGIDTALIYRDQAEVAKAIAAVGVDRRSLFITTKIPGCSFAKDAVEADLHQLQTDYIDLLLIHTPYGGDCSKAWATLEDFHARGVLKAIGVSNFKRGNLELLLKTAKVVPAVNQIQHNVLEHDDDTIAFSRAHNITIEAFSPLGRGGHSGNITGNEVIKSIASKHNVSVYQVALKWILQHGHILTFQSTSSAHQEEDADLFRFSLSAEDMSALDGLGRSSGGELEVLV